MSRFDNSKIKAMFGGKGFYIALALCLLAAGTIGYITLFSADSPAKEPDPVIEIKPAPVTPVPAAPTKPVIQSEPVEVPVQETETVIEEPVELLPEVISPLDGTTVTVFSMTELLYDQTMADWRTHNGIDYACAKDAAVQSPTAGTVVLAGSDGSWGPTVAIKDSAGRVWRLCGVASPAVKEGETVSAGQTLGKVGSVSCECAEESHIHLEVKQDDSYLDPAKLMQ